MSQVAPCPPRPGAGSRKMPEMLRFALAFILLLASTQLFAAQSPQARASGAAVPVQVVPAFPCADQDVRLLFRYCTCNERVVDTQRVDLLHERILVEVDSSVVCVQCAPDTFGINLARFPVGHHRFLTEVTYRWGSSDSSATHTDYYVNEFDVRPACGQNSSIPFLTAVNIGIDAPCTVCPPHVCAGDSVQVYLHGEFPDASYALVEATATQDSLSPIPTSQVRLVYSRACSGVQVPTSWSASFPIAPMVYGSNGLRVTAYLRDDCHAGVPQWIGEARFPIAVDQCEGQRDCYTASFLRQPGQCDAYVAPGNPGFAWLGITSDRPIGGVQGRLVFDRPGLHVQSIEPAYAGSVLKWDRTADGANFVIVVPPDSMPPSPPDVLRMLLSVRVALDVGAVIDGIVRLQPVDLLVSDPAGQRVQQCAVRTTGPGPVEVIDNSARFCTEVGCDYNGDGRSDVRDLVLMVNCLLYPPPNARCPAPPDCNGDEQNDLDDVLCCARRILHGSPPDSVHAVPAPEVTLAFGTPVLVAGGVDLPVMVGGIGRIGATRLEFSYPDEAFASASVELNDPSGHWLALDEAGGGRAVFGGIRLSPEDAYGALPLTLHLRTRAGQQVAGSVSFVAGDFSDANGATLITSARPVTMPIGGGRNIALRAARPNPFGAETHFGVGLAQAADLEVVVYDLAGRRVATLFKGRAAAGTHEITWRRTREDGSLVPSGIYFYRIVSGGEQQGGKLLVLARD